MNKYFEAGESLKSLNVQHPIWNRTLDLALSHITLAAPGEVVCIMGPSRVGKSRLSWAIRELVNQSGVGIHDRQSLSIGVRASNCAKNGSFSTKAFVTKALQELQHPIFGGQKNVGDGGDSTGRQYGTSEHDLWLALERGLPAAGKRYMFVDETQNIIRAIGKNGPAGVLDAWKCVAEDAGVVLVLTGTYPLHSVLQTAGHVVGRKGAVHFPRYQVTREDIVGFNQILRTYSKYLPLAPHVGTLDRYSQYFYMGSMGCIGLLERWLRNALSIAMADKADITFEMLKQSRLCDSDRKAISREILEGEELVLTSDLVENQPFDTGLPLAYPDPLIVMAQKQDAECKPKRKRPFVCNPTRRQAGERTKGVVDV